MAKSNGNKKVHRFEVVVTDNFGGSSCFEPVKVEEIIKILRRTDMRTAGLEVVSVKSLGAKSTKRLAKRLTRRIDQVERIRFAEQK